MSQKIVRTVTGFCAGLENVPSTLEKVKRAVEMLQQAGYLVQTDRICVDGVTLGELRSVLPSDEQLCSVGTLTLAEAKRDWDDFLALPNSNFNLDITDGVSRDEVGLLFEIMREGPAKTFGFTYVVNNRFNSPYFPSATYGRSGFSLGLQSTNLAAGCDSIEEWLVAQRVIWRELIDLFRYTRGFIGIDSSVAPIFDQDSSLIHFIKRVTPSFPESITTDVYTRITRFIMTENPWPTGLCGLMFPCLEDFELAKAYEAGQFSIERNLFLSLHSGLGIDTYPIGMDESPERVFEILSLLRALSNKYEKPLSARFVSDGKAKIGEQTDFQNQYLADVVVHPL